MLGSSWVVAQLAAPQDGLSSVSEWLYTHIRVHSHVFTSRYLVAVSNGGRSPSYRFPNCPRPQLPASRLNLRSSRTQSLHKLNSTALSPLQHLDSDHTEVAFPLLLYATAVVETSLFVKPSLSNGCCISAYLAVVAQKRVNISHYSEYSLCACFLVISVEIFLFHIQQRVAPHGERIQVERSCPSLGDLAALFVTQPSLGTGRTRWQGLTISITAEHGEKQIVAKSVPGGPHTNTGCPT
jgi:hypothetical protein